jgi:activating signal cointegrator 1
LLADAGIPLPCPWLHGVLLVKAITICQPYAHLIRLNLKPIENRNWGTSYRGELYIHAGKSREWLDAGDEQRYPDMAYGAIVARVNMRACLWLDRLWPEEWRHLQEHEHATGPYCHIYQDIVPLPVPIPCRGAQGFWEIPHDVADEIRRQLGSTS